MLDVSAIAACTLFGFLFVFCNVFFFKTENKKHVFELKLCTDEMALVSIKRTELVHLFIIILHSKNYIRLNT